VARHAPTRAVTSSDKPVFRLPLRRIVAVASLLAALGVVAFAATDGTPGAMPAPDHIGVGVVNR
jgi:hypothetical protein